jgi:hypothetical protein
LLIAAARAEGGPVAWQEQPSEGRAAREGARGLQADLGSLLQGGGAFADDLRLLAVDGAIDVSRSLLSARCDFVRTCLNNLFGTSHSIEAEPCPTIDLTPYGISMVELLPILRYVYTGRVTEPHTTRTHTHLAGLAGDLAMMDPALACELLPHASALLLDSLKQLCEAVLNAVVDADNAAVLRDLAESSFAHRLKATCEDVLLSAQ